MDRSNYTSINIDVDPDDQVPLVDSMAKKLQGLPPLSTECIIYRVPERLRGVKESAYSPKAVSIGPLHHGTSEALRTMEEHKMRYLGDFIGRTEKGLEFFVNVVRENEAKLRSSYAESIQFSSDKFVQIILVDAAFVIEVLLKSHNSKLVDESDRIFRKPWKIQDVWSDMLLLENQLPFFILKDLFSSYKEQVRRHDDETLTMRKLTKYFFKSRMESRAEEERWDEISSPEFKIEHFVRLLRHLQSQPVNVQVSNMKLRTLTTPSMTELHQAGVKFNVGSSRNLFDIKFNNGILEIPKFILSDERELIIRNLLAFEQCHVMENYINDYVIIMNRLVNTHKDMDLLVKHQIVENRFNNTREGSQLLNKLADGAILDQNTFYFAQLSEQLNTYCGTSWHKWKANLKQRYFNTPWATISVIVAVVLLILTIAQTVFSGISVRPEPNRSPSRSATHGKLH